MERRLKYNGKEDNGCRWLWTIALVWCSLSWSQAQIEPLDPAAHQLTLVTWNIQMLPRSMSAFSAALRKRQHTRLPWIIEHCQAAPYDVIVFQEVFDQAISRRLQKALRQEYPHQIKPLKKIGRLTSSGILMVSRYPLEKIDGVVYPKGVTADAWAAKGCTLAKLTKGEASLYIAGTHLQAGRSERAKFQRAIQYRLMQQLIAKHTQADQQPIIITGDLNTPSTDSSAYLDMLTVLKATDTPLDDPRPYTIDNQNTWNKGDKNKQLDYVLYQHGRASTEVVKQQILRLQQTWKGHPMDLSDHYGIIAQIHWMD